ncbi:MAG: hypothetical protein ACI8UO_002817 [Verrucomicrobiales bacterium]|jgi:hypothetical protein
MRFKKCLTWLGSHIRAAAKLPGFALIVLILGSFVIGENYPFSPFPMYSDPSKQTVFLYLEDEKGDPVGVKTHTNVSSSALSKTYGKYLDRIGEKKDIQPYKLPIEDQAAAGLETLEFLRKKARDRGKKGEGLPATLRLIRVDLYFVQTGGPPRSEKRLLVEQTETKSTTPK